MQRMQQSVVTGVNPSAAASEVLRDGKSGAASGNRSGAASNGAPRRGGPGGSVLAVPGANREVRGLARAASRLDEGGVTAAVLGALKRKGAVATWNGLLRPVLVAAGDHWQRTDTGIEVEHLLTQALTTAFAGYIGMLPKVAQDSPVVVAGSPHEDHVLALHAVRATLAERSVPVRFLGPRTPLPALAATARLTKAPALLLWMSLPDAQTAEGLSELRAAHRSLVVLVGGVGWEGLDLGPATLCRSLDDAVERLADAWARRPAGSVDRSH